VAASCAVAAILGRHRRDSCDAQARVARKNANAFRSFRIRHMARDRPSHFGDERIANCIRSGFVRNQAFVIRACAATLAA